MSTTPNPDALVVGAGPVGLVAAAELARRGVRVRVLDKLAQPTDQSRAIAVHARSLDMLDRMGIVDEMVSTGVKAIAMQLYAGHRRLFRIPFGDVDSAFPFTLTTAQTETERVLGEHLRSLGVSVERGVELVALTQDDDAAHLTLRHADGSTEQVSTAWVIGADGAHSTVRKLVGTKLAGSFVGERFLLGDVDVEHDLDMDSMHTFFAPDGPVVVLPMAGGRMRFLAEVHPNTRAAGTPMNMHPTQDQLQAIIDRRIGGIRIVHSHWLTSFEIHHARVPALRWGRVFLAGDAAHIHSPAGGQGMNTGMQDAFNLAWKLAAVVKGDAGDGVLDSYEAERLPVADGVITFTDRLTRAGTLSGAPRRIRDVVIRMLSHVPAARRFMANMAEEVNINYRNSPIAVGRAPKRAKVAAGDHLPHAADAAVQKQLSAMCGAVNTGHVVLTVASGHVAPAAGEGQTQVLVTADDAPVAGYDAVIADPKGVVAQRLGLKSGGRLVIRPDGYLGAIASLQDTTTIAAYFAKVGS